MDYKKASRMVADVNEMLQNEIDKLQQETQSAETAEEPVVDLKVVEEALR